MAIKDNLAPLHGYEIRGLQKPDQEANNAFIHGLQSELDVAEKNMYKAKLESFLDTADDEWLDYWGSWLGLHRYSWEKDNDYRKRLKGHVLHQRNTINAIRQAVAEFLKTNMSNIYIYEPYRDMMIYNSSKWNTYKFYPSTYYRYAVIDVEIDAPINNVVSEVINLFRPAGVYWVLTSLVNVLNEKAPIIDFSGDTTSKIESTDLDYIGFNYRNYTHITPNLNKNFEITDPFIYNDSLLNGGKVYYAYDRAISRVAWLGKALDNVTPKVTDTYMDAFNDVTHLSAIDDGRLSNMDQAPVEFDVSGKSNQPINLWPDDNLAHYTDWNWLGSKDKISSYIDNDGQQVLHFDHEDNLDATNIGPYYIYNVLQKGKHYILTVDVRGSNMKAYAFNIHENVANTKTLGVDLTKGLSKTWTRTATLFTPDKDNPSGAFIYYCENVDKTKPGWFEIKDICLQEVDDFTPYIKNNVIPGYVDLPGNLNRTTLMGAIDLFDYFQDDNKDLADDKQKLVLSNVENQDYKALVVRFRKNHMIGNQTVTLYMYDFTVNMWVSYQTFTLTSDKYQLAKIQFDTIKPYLNKNGIIFMKLVPKQKAGTIDVDYFGFNFGGTITKIKCDTPSQDGLGAEIK